MLSVAVLTIILCTMIVASCLLISHSYILLVLPTYHKFASGQR